MIGLIVCSMVVVFIWLEAKPLLKRRLIVTERLADLEIQRVDNERLALLKPSVRDADPMPQDMIEWAMQESFDWAREDKLARMNELYGKLKNWGKVRNALMAEEDTSLKSTF